MNSTPYHTSTGSVTAHLPVIELVEMTTGTIIMLENFPKEVLVAYIRENIFASRDNMERSLKRIDARIKVNKAQKRMDDALLKMQEAKGNIDEWRNASARWDRARIDLTKALDVLSTGD